MTPLVKNNPHIRDFRTLRRWLEENAYESSVFEGARGLSKPGVYPPRPRRRRASAKNAVKGAKSRR